MRRLASVDVIWGNEPWSLRVRDHSMTLELLLNGAICLSSSAAEANGVFRAGKRRGYDVHFAAVGKEKRLLFTDNQKWIKDVLPCGQRWRYLLRERIAALVAGRIGTAIILSEQRETVRAMFPAEFPRLRFSAFGLQKVFLQVRIEERKTA